jgi:outer membrane protein
MIDLSHTTLTMKKIFLFVFAFFALINIQAQQKKWTLQECVAHALENNISVKQSQLDVDFAEIAERDALGNFIPSLNINSSLANSSGLTINPTTNQFQTTRFTSFSGSATTALTLFDGLRNVREMQRSKLATLASQYSLELMKDDIAFL